MFLYGQMDCSKAKPDEDVDGKDKDKVSLMRCVTDGLVLNRKFYSETHSSPRVQAAHSVGEGLRTACATCSAASYTDPIPLCEETKL